MEATQRGGEALLTVLEPLDPAVPEGDAAPRTLYSHKPHDSVGADASLS